MFEADPIPAPTATRDASVLSDDDLVGRTDDAWASVGGAQRRLLDLLREVARREAWRADGAQDLTHWVSMRYGVSAWKAQRWVASAEALAGLPLTADALETGMLGLDQVVELTRFATPGTEGDLVAWAAERASGTIRRRADLERRRDRDELLSAERERYLRMGYNHDGSRFELEAELPADQGAVVAAAITRLAETTLVMPDDDAASRQEARRADALLMLCSSRIASDPDPDRATVVVHTSVETLLAGAGGPNAEVADGPVLAPVTTQRLACDARIQGALDDASGTPLMLGRLTRNPSTQMLRALRRRDRTCRFPGCDRRRYAHAHHVSWWSRGGRTDLGNLVLLCGFHHRLVHEGGWRLSLHPDAAVTWFRPNGARYRAGPSTTGPPSLE